ncbi:MAG: HEAT repeat domain-containing protein [bacterium]
MKCLYCGKNNCPENWTFCNECGVNIKEYIKATDFINKGLELEKNLEYAKAAEEYRHALKLKVPTDKILVNLERVVAKEETIIREMELGTELLRQKKWAKAIRMYEKILKNAPSFEKDILPNLMEARAMHGKKVKKMSILLSIIAIILAVGTTFLYKWMHCPTQEALRTLKKSVLSNDILEKQEALDIIGRLQDNRLLPLVRESLKNNNPVIRATAARVLGELKDTTSISISLLKECLHDKDWQVSIEAAKSLALVGNAAGIEFLKKSLK